MAGNQHNYYIRYAGKYNLCKLKDLALERKAWSRIKKVCHKPVGTTKPKRDKFVVGHYLYLLTMLITQVICIREKLHKINF